MTEKYFGWFERKRVNRPPARLTPGWDIRQQLERELIEDLIDRHIENYMDSLPRLYAQLLIKSLCQIDPVLMDEFGERVASLDTQQRRHA
jgi:hypothetical protein